MRIEEYSILNIDNRGLEKGKKLVIKYVRKTGINIILVFYYE